jgi:hypothetical protein
MSADIIDFRAQREKRGLEPPKASAELPPPGFRQGDRVRVKADLREGFIIGGRPERVERGGLTWVLVVHLPDVQRIFRLDDLEPVPPPSLREMEATW